MSNKLINSKCFECLTRTSLYVVVVTGTALFSSPGEAGGELRGEEDLHPEVSALLLLDDQVPAPARAELRQGGAQVRVRHRQTGPAHQRTVLHSIVSSPSLVIESQTPVLLD